ncbi:hypothetical protein BVU17_06960 [Haloarcula taiwanensis]|uniref:Cox cluster protein n=1 Tax=Haloarcula taiwanensis TaxID=1932004 RepID=A0A2H4ZXS4_9EURY|nr:MULTISPECIES: hypothetical protein [Haloarcula]AUG47275.1 hypothetical protein BVU17_06960 [Haloarcula taiwanensis]RLM34058.1 hypothetical protein DVK01_16425 [Haloarcula sp. Atlit-120R]RLM42370.1 hypothetical protein DVK00_14955 [Haloarcula sp. Atlit-47R]
MQQHTTVIDKAAMALSGGLMLLGVVVLGIVEILAGKPYSAAPLTNEAGEVIATPMVDPTLRTGLVLAGILVLALYGLYKLVAPMKGAAATTQQDVTAD